MDLDRAIKTRKSVRKFSSRKPDWRAIIEAIDLARYAPIAGKNFCLKFILVSDEGKINSIAKACQQDFISQASYVVVAYSDSTRMESNFGEKGKIFLRQQAGAAIQNFLLKIEEKGLDSCWIGHFVEEQIKRELKIPASAEVEGVFPIGFAAEKKRERRRIDLDNILYFNEAGNRKMGMS